jgi:nucleoside-diphosphate-sugar epimerase
MTSYLSDFPGDDLDFIFNGLSESEWRFFANKNIFITGGTGFIGKWLLAALLNADYRLNLNCKVLILSRSPKAFQLNMPGIATCNGVQLLQGDIRNFDFPKGRFDIIVHGATDVIEQQTPMETFSTCLDGTQRVLEFARVSNASDFLLTSSGAIYGSHAQRLRGMSEDVLSGPDPTLPSSAYAEGKRASEWLACASGNDSGLKVKIARIYAQVGPHLPLDKHFAIGNFILDAMAGREIIVRGDGSPVRSYLYAAETALWLWAMLIRGKSGRAWNVGGNEGISIAGLAELVAKLLGSRNGVRILSKADPCKAVDFYVPNVDRVLQELNLSPTIALNESILRTVNWYRGRAGY